jgi:hypothetical protein
MLAEIFVAKCKCVRTIKYGIFMIHLAFPKIIIKMPGFANIRFRVLE